MRKILPSLASAALLLNACSSTPPAPSMSKPAVPPTKTVQTHNSGGYYLDDGPEANPPPNLAAVPDAVPRSEPLHKFANRAYVALGNTYVPMTARRPYTEEGLASWYGRRFQGKRTASGEPYDMYAMTAAHPTLPIPSYARVTSLATGKSVVVRINDRGPFHSNRIMDLSYTAAYKLGYLGSGSTRVRVESLDPASYDTQGEALGAGIYLQVGAFSRAENARQLLDRLTHELALDASQTRMVLNGNLHRVQLGPYPNDEAAASDRTRVRERLTLNAVVVKRD